MSGKHERPKSHRTKPLKRGLAILLALTMICALVPSSVTAAGDAEFIYLCGHVHDETCGYCEGSPCTDVHVHDETCGYTEASPCADLHIHDESCGCIEAVTCNYVHVHDESCGYVETVACSHTHGVECGYESVMPSAPCTHVCYILSFDGYTPGTAIDTYEAAAGAELEEITAALPASLPGMLACAEGSVDIPVRWSCADFTGAVGTYDFYAELTNVHCEYSVIDDESTADADESELPFISVMLPETAPAPSDVLDSYVHTILDATNTVSVTGPMPEDARLAVRALTEEELASYMAEGANVVFAYDITIMTLGELDESTGLYVGETEYLPAAERPVTVTITPPEPIAAAVEVVHISEDTDTGETILQPVTGVTTTESAVEFTAESFSIYIGTTARAEVSSYPAEIYYTSNGFYSDKFNFADETKIVKSDGTDFATMQELVSALNGDTTIYMKAAYTVAGTESIGNSSCAVALKRSGDMNGDGAASDPYTGKLIDVAGSLTLNNITLDGGAVWASGAGSANSGLTVSEPLVTNNGTLTVGSGAILQNNASTGAGGGIYNYRTLQLTGGEITGNTAGDAGGGGVYARGLFTISGVAHRLQLFNQRCG